MLYFYYTLFC